MTVPQFTGELAALHPRDLEDGASRVATSAPPDPRHVRVTALSVRVRPVRPGDAALLAAVFDGLSPASRVSRFLVPKRQLTAAELRYLTDVDHHDHEAIIALTRRRGEPIGVARFIRDTHDPASAEVAVEVVDEWQNLGVGSMLVTRLAARARSENVTTFNAIMSADNRRSQRLASKIGSITDAARDGSTVTYRVALPRPASIPAQRRATFVASAGCA
jgi:RimJ/RimL family protein N-acetyltransferase